MLRTTVFTKAKTLGEDLQFYYEQHVAPRINACLAYCQDETEKAQVISFFLSLVTDPATRRKEPADHLADLLTLINGLASRQSLSTDISLASDSSKEVFIYIFKIFLDKLSESELSDDLKLQSMKIAHPIMEMSDILAKLREFICTKLGEQQAALAETLRTQSALGCC